MAQITSDAVKQITNYYAALNELAAMLQDKEINEQDWTIQVTMIHWAYRGL
jgi:hypothetical protein